MLALLRRLHGWLGHTYKPPKRMENGHGEARCICGAVLCVSE